MTNTYTMKYGYASIIYPARMFSTREDAQSFDDVESRSALLSPYFNRQILEMIARGNVPEDAEETARTILAAMRWIVNAADDAAQTKRIAEYHAKNAEDASEVDAVVEKQERK
jgi:CMP-2-keto-3-deoxyoctulosonic acid synthetase